MGDVLPAWEGLEDGLTGSTVAFTELLTTHKLFLGAPRAVRGKAEF